MADSLFLLSFIHSNASIHCLFIDVMLGHVLGARCERVYSCTREHGTRADSRRQIDTRGVIRASSLFFKLSIFIRNY